MTDNGRPSQIADKRSAELSDTHELKSEIRREFLPDRVDGRRWVVPAVFVDGLGNVPSDVIATRVPDKSSVTQIVVPPDAPKGRRPPRLFFEQCEICAAAYRQGPDTDRIRDPVYRLDLQRRAGHLGSPFA